MRLKSSSNFPSGLEVCVPNHFSAVPGPTNDRCSRWNLCAYSLTSSEFEILSHRTSTWIELFPRIVLDLFFELPDLPGSFWEFLLMWFLGTNSTRTPLDLHQFLTTRRTNWIVGSLGFDFSIFHSLLNDHAFFPDTRLNLSRHVPLPLPWMSDQEYFELNLHTNSILLRRYWADLPSEVCEITVLYSKIPQ